MRQRYEELDALRGLAALTVFLSHIVLLFPKTPTMKKWIDFGPLRLLTSGSEAVVLFFLLSGFVLSLPFYSTSEVPYAGFLIKRICRIYMPYLAALAVALGCSRILYSGPVDSLSDWFLSFWNRPLSLSDLKDHVLLLPSFLSNVNPVLWSLIHEMRISIVFPLLMLALARWKAGPIVLLILGFSSVSVLAHVFLNPGNDGVEWTYTLHFTAFFLTGALLARHRDTISHKVGAMTSGSRLFVLAVALLLYAYGKPSYGVAALTGGAADPYYRAVFDSWATAAGASLLMMLALSPGGWSAALRRRLPILLGKISYSLYLLHIPILFGLIHVLHKKASTPIIVLIAIPLTIGFSYVMYRIVELPSMIWGRRLAKHLERTERTAAGRKGTAA